MYYYWLERGLDAVKVLAENFRNRTWYLPDFIPDEIIDEVKSRVKNIEFYHIDSLFNWSANVGTGSEPKVFYLIDFFGNESLVGKDSPPNTIVIRDGVWLPEPFIPVEHNQIWFNSFRKILPGQRGSAIISPYRLSGPSEVPNLYKHPLLTWQEIQVRNNNYYHCQDIFKDIRQLHHHEFPSVFPILLKNREKVLMGLDVKLSDPWKDKYGLGNKLYKELTLIPIDSRFSKQDLTELADKIKELSDGFAQG